MIFFVAMPLVIGLMNFVVPLQLGIRDVAFPTMNSVSFWLTASGVLLTNASLAFGEFAKTGWVAYPPLSELQFSPGVGVDYYLWSLQISGIGTLLTGVNFVTTILKMRAPGMSYMRMPVFCWTALASNLLIVAAFPVLTALFAMLLLDRYLGFHFFTVNAGGNAMMYVNLFWVWGHPEVYILVLPAFGIYSEVSATFSGKPLFGYRSMVFATIVDLRARLLGLAASLLHHGRQRQRQRHLRHSKHDYRRADGCQNLQLDVHDVRRPGSIYGAGAVDDRLHGVVRIRRSDRRICWRCRRSIGRFTTASSWSLISITSSFRASCSGPWRATITGFPRHSGSSSKNAGGRRRSGAGSSASISPSCRSMWWA